MVAMQLSSRHNCPTIVARLNDEGYIRGSARGLNQSELKSFKEFMNETGLFEYTMGHDNACGISILNSNLAKFHAIANEKFKNLDFGESVYIADFARDSYAEDLKAIISDLAQYEFVWGQQNNEPTILITDINLTKSDISIIGKNKDTLRFQVNGITYIKFFAKELIEKINRINGVMRLTIVGTANLNEWNFKITPQVLIKDLDIEEVGNISF